jgi:glycosyltransferase involved in cell wall biosynthesis
VNILFVVPAYAPAWSFGGVVTSTVNLCEALVSAGHQVTVATCNVDANGDELDVDLGRPIFINGVCVHYFSVNFIRKKLFFSWAQHIFLKKNISNYDILDVSAVWQFNGFLLSRLCVKKNRSFVLTPHSSYMKNAMFGVGNQIVKKVYFSLFGKHLIKNASAIHFLSDGEKLESIASVRGKYSYTIPNGISEKLLKINPLSYASLREKLAIQKNDIVLIYAGRVHRKKQLELVIQAMYKLNQKGSVYKFIIVGSLDDDSYANQLKKLSIKLNQNKNIVWHDEVPSKDLATFFALSDIFCLPSKIEGVSMSITEAMKAGVAILTSWGTANASEINKDEAGIIVGQSGDEVAQAIKIMTSSEEVLESYKVNAQKSFSKRYSIDSVAAETVKYYRHINGN